MLSSNILVMWIVTSLQLTPVQNLACILVLVEGLIVVVCVVEGLHDVPIYDVTCSFILAINLLAVVCAVKSFQTRII